MLKSQLLINLLIKHDINFLTGVPCSILQDFLHFVSQDKRLQHLPATSEGEACAIATGYYLATGKIPVVYMQNSGLGNAINPLTSLMDQKIFAIPALLLISWRGEPQTQDAIEHIKMGKILLPLLKTLGIPYQLLPCQVKSLTKVFVQAKKYFKKHCAPFAFIVRQNTFAAEKIKLALPSKYTLTREKAIRIMMDRLGGKEYIISTTGKTSRELFEYQEGKNKKHDQIFYMVGSMGAAPGIALGIALQHPRKKIFVFDGDGALLMKLGTLATIGHSAPKNFYHIVFDNEAYASTGGQTTVSGTTNLTAVARACGYQCAKTLNTKKALINFCRRYQKMSGPVFIRVKIKKGTRENLGRPTITPQKNKKLLMQNLL